MEEVQEKKPEPEKEKAKAEKIDIQIEDEFEDVPCQPQIEEKPVVPQIACTPMPYMQQFVPLVPGQIFVTPQNRYFQVVFQEVQPPKPQAGIFFAAMPPQFLQCEVKK